MNFTLDYSGNMRDMSTMTGGDLKALNRWFKDWDVRFGKRGTALPSNAWRVSPQYLNEQMRLQEQKFFATFENPVQTSDGMVMKEVKVFTGTIGAMKELMRVINLQEGAMIDHVMGRTNDLYSYREQMTVGEARDLHKLIVERIESNNPKSTYTKYNGQDLARIKAELKDKIFEITRTDPHGRKITELLIIRKT